jgi:hypothetical protein
MSGAGGYQLPGPQEIRAMRKIHTIDELAKIAGRERVDLAENGVVDYYTDNLFYNYSKRTARPPDRVMGEMVCWSCALSYFAIHPAEFLYFTCPRCCIINAVAVRDFNIQQEAVKSLYEKQGTTWEDYLMTPEKALQEGDRSLGHEEIPEEDRVRG